jgi:flagella basal body P-ring formation protein FlgA
MKKILFCFYFIISITSLFPVEFSQTPMEISLKDRINTDEKTIVLSEIINETIPPDIGNIKITELNYFPYRLKNDLIMSKLIEKGYKDIILSGKEILIYKNNIEKTADLETNVKITDPIKFLENYLSSFIDKNLYQIKVNVTGTEPSIDITSIKDDFTWEFDRMNYGLKDIADLKKLVLKTNDKKYNISININIFSRVWISKKSFQKDENLAAISFYMKNVDITAYKNPESIISDINSAADMRFTENIGTGEVLRWNQLKKNPLIIKDQNLKIIITDKNLELSVNCTASGDGYLNEKIKVKLVNGKEKIGMLRKNSGGFYVELQ